MNEIEKLYKNAGIKPVCLIPDRYCGMQPIYDDFTAEKQLELIKWLARNEMLYRLEDEYPYFERFEECIAYIINYIWQDLTEQEQIKEILNG